MNMQILSSEDEDEVQVEKSVMNIQIVSSDENDPSDNVSKS